MLDDDYRIPVLIRIEPERLINQIGEDRDIGEHISDLLNRGLRGSLKTGNRSQGRCMSIWTSIQKRHQ